MTTIHGQAHINDGAPVPATLTIEREHVDVTTRWERDPDWTHTDSAGHFHAYDQDGKLPTLDKESTPAPCDGTCGGACGGEGYTHTTYRCGLCREVVEPQIRPGRRKTIPGRYDIEIVVDTHVDRGHASFRFLDTNGKLLAFGFAIAGSSRGGGGPDGIWSQTTLNPSRLGLAGRLAESVR